MIRMEENIIMLEDENGNTAEYEAIDVFEFNDSTYFVLLEVLPEGEENDEVVIMKVLFGETEDDMDLIAVEDEDELEAAFNEFLRRDEEANQ